MTTPGIVGMDLAQGQQLAQNFKTGGADLQQGRPPASPDATRRQ